MGMKVTTSLYQFAAKLNSPALKQKVEAVAQSKGIVSLIIKGIAKNFADEGPGWLPLKVATIKGSISQAKRNKLNKTERVDGKKTRVISDKEILQYESLVRKRGKNSDEREKLAKISAKIHKNAPKNGPAPHRMILQRTGLLKKTVTTPGASGSTTGKKPISGSNVYKVEGHTIIWGTDLVYAGVHQKGNPAKGIPARPYLDLKDATLEEIYDFCIERYADILQKEIGSK